MGAWRWVAGVAVAALLALAFAATAARKNVSACSFRRDALWPLQKEKLNRIRDNHFEQIHTVLRHRGFRQAAIEQVTGDPFGYYRYWPNAKAQAAQALQEQLVTESARACSHYSSYEVL